MTGSTEANNYKPSAGALAFAGMTAYKMNDGLCGNTWFQPNYGANGVYYRVVPTP